MRELEGNWIGEMGAQPKARRGGIPRGVRADGLPLLSYGFRPFFLSAGVFALIAMLLWLGALVLGWPIGGSLYGPLYWHGHEMLFGYAAAALAGFLLTTIPNWTGRLPVAGGGLLALVLLWAAGRVAMAAPEMLGIITAAVDGAFLPVLALFAAREIIAGRNWRNIKIVAALALLSATNVGFHATVLLGGDTAMVLRATVAVFIMLIGLVGGRIVPSFTRNFLAKVGALKLPAPFSRYDAVAMLVLGAALLSWIVAPTASATAAAALFAGLTQVWRLVRWRGHAAWRDPMLVILHVGYAFVPAGLFAISLAALGFLHSVSALHLLTVGGIGTMTVGVMTRASLGHTGRPTRASSATVAAFAAIVLAAAVRPFAELAPDHTLLLLAISGALWVLAFMLFCLEYGRILLSPRWSPPLPNSRAAAAVGSPALGQPAASQQLVTR